MEALATLNNQRQFDFQNNGIEVMDLETLQRTYKENDIYGNPVRGIYHYQVIQRMTDICRRHNLNYEVEEIFAAQNKNRTQPGVVILPQVEQTYGEKAVEAQNIHHHPYSERGYRRTDNHTRGSLPSGRYPGGNRSLRTYLPQPVYPFTRTKRCQLR